MRELTKVVDHDALVEHGSVIAGTPEHCARRTEEMEERFGFTDLRAWTCMGGLDHRKVMRSMELEVIPHFKEEDLRGKVAAATGA